VSASTRELEAIREQIAAIEGELERREPGGRWADQASALRAEIERVGERYERRLAALAQVERALEGLRAITSPAAILARAPAVLCEHSALERTVLSLLSDGLLLAEAAHFAGDAAAAEQALAALRDEPPRLEHPLIEAELLRRPRATIVTPASRRARVHAVLETALGGERYVAAPVLAGGALIGALHSSRTHGPALDVLDGDVLWAFARGLGEVYEVALLRRALRRQREQLRAFAEWLGARALELSAAPAAFTAERPAPPDPPGLPEGLGGATGGVDDRRVFEGLLTRRELEILRLLARGLSNEAIAAELVISEATVKFHVVNLLRKLRVASRAGAVARYHRLVRRVGADA
jgi:DNA-binding CsgD family transcriptional regulator